MNGEANLSPNGEGRFVPDEEGKVSPDAVRSFSQERSKIAQRRENATEHKGATSQENSNQSDPPLLIASQPVREDITHIYLQGTLTDEKGNHDDVKEDYKKCYTTCKKAYEVILRTQGILDASAKDARLEL